MDYLCPNLWYIDFPLSNRISLMVMKESNRKMSKRALPVSRTLFQLPGQSLDQFECFETAWFPKLIILCFGMALIIAADLLFSFPPERSISVGIWDAGIPADPEIAESFAKMYCILIGLCALILIVFISVCLAIQSRGFIQPHCAAVSWQCVMKRKLGPCNELRSST